MFSIGIVTIVLFGTLSDVTALYGIVESNRSPHSASNVRKQHYPHTLLELIGPAPPVFLAPRTNWVIRLLYRLLIVLDGWRAYVQLKHALANFFG